MTYLRLILLFTLLATSLAHAQSVLTWNATGGPCGFSVQQLISVQSELLAVGGQKIHGSTDGGQTWSYRGSIDVPGFLAYGHAVSPSGEILLGGHGNQTGSVLFRSADKGRTWAPLSLPGRSGAAIAITSNGTIFAGGPNGPIYRSSNNGATWEETSASHVLGGMIGALPDGSIFIGGTVDAVHGIYRSTDNGQTWTSLLPLEPNRWVMRVVTSGESNVDIVTYHLGRITIAQSKDGGIQWTESLMPPDVTSIESILPLPSEHALYVGTNTGKVLRRNTDAGEWEQVGRRLPDKYVTALAFDSQHQQLVAGQGFGPLLLANNDAGEQIWVRSCGNIYELGSTHIGVSPEGKVLAASFGGGLNRSSQTGDNWQLATYPEYGINSVAEGSDGAAVFGTALGGLYRVMPGEDTARRIDRNFSSPTIQSVAIGRDNEILAGTPNGGLYFSTDNGTTWDSIQHTGAIRSIVPHDNDIYLATADGLYKRSPDKTALLWIEVGPGTPSLFALSIAPGGYMAAASGGRAWLSTDSGNRWTSLPGLAPDHFITSIVVNSDGKVYAVVKQSALRYGRIHHYSLRSPSWKNADLATDSLGAYALAITSGGTLYATTATQVFRASIPATVPLPPLSPSLGISPTPASTSAEIRFALPSAGETVLRLSDQTGREVLRQALGHRAAGENVVEIDVSTLTPGLYSCEIDRGATRLRSILRVVR